VTPDGEWEPEAENWVHWARSPGFDAYWYFRDTFFDSVLPAAGGRTLEIGCGEGRVARDLVARGHQAVAVDTAQSLVRHAIESDHDGRYALADGAALPFPDGCFDVVVAYNALQVVGDMGRTVSEAGRVVGRGGRLCACVAHPVTDLGQFTDDDADPAFVIRRDYFENRRVDDTVESEGHTMTFRGWTYSLEHYSRALEAAGFRIELLREPVPPRTAEKYARWRAIPLFLMFRAVKT
jgi:ubiquinone/menaquinone biosynthesis C-methylase UbiE